MRQDSTDLTEFDSNEHVTLELFGMPRIVAGTDRVAVSGATLSAILAETVDQHPALAEHLLRSDGQWINNGYTLVVDGTFTSDPEFPVSPASEVFLVSRASGG